MSRRLIPLLLCLAALAGGCALLSGREEVGDAQARALLDRAIGLVASGRRDELCTLARPLGANADARTTCEESLESVGALMPTSAPTIRCSYPLPPTGPLRGGRVLVVEGVDGVDDPYRSEFLVYHDGGAVRVLDPVYWNGLSIDAYTGTQVAWRFDSGSTVCEDRALPGDAGTPVPLPDQVVPGQPSVQPAPS